MIDIKELEKRYEFIIGFESKIQRDAITEQDKKHVRIMAVLQIAKNGDIEQILKREFSEKFIYDKEDQTVYYCVKFNRKKKGVIYADS